MGWSSVGWLAGAAAIIVPILLHLRDRQPPELVRVGSVADLLPAAAVQRRRRLDDIPLLLLRCLVLVLAAVLMAGLQLDDRTMAAGRRVAVIVQGDSLADSLTASDARVADLPRSPRPWSLAAWADTTIGPDDTLLLGPAPATMHAGPRPVIGHAVVPLGATPPGMAPAHRLPRVETNGDAPVRRRDRSTLVWWLLVMAIGAERVIASRVRG